MFWVSEISSHGAPQNPEKRLFSPVLSTRNPLIIYPTQELVVFRSRRSPAGALALSHLIFQRPSYHGKQNESDFHFACPRSANAGCLGWEIDNARFYVNNGEVHERAPAPHSENVTAQSTMEKMSQRPPVHCHLALYFHHFESFPSFDSVRPQVILYCSASPSAHKKCYGDS